MDTELQDWFFQRQEEMADIKETFDGLCRSWKSAGLPDGLLQQFQAEMVVCEQKIGRACGLGVSSEQQRVQVLAVEEQFGFLRDLARWLLLQVRNPGRRFDD